MQPDFNERVKESIKSGTSRAVLMSVRPGDRDDCAGECGEKVVFQAKVKPVRVLCNVYVDKVWDHTEAFHPNCYVDAGAPHGPALGGNVQQLTRRVIDATIASIEQVAQAQITGGPA